MSKLHSLTVDYVGKEKSVAQMERGYLQQVLSLCMVLLKFVIRQKVNQLRDYRPGVLETEQNKDIGGTNKSLYEFVWSA